MNSLQMSDEHLDRAIASEVYVGPMELEQAVVRPLGVVPDVTSIGHTLKPEHDDVLELLLALSELSGADR